MLDVGSLPSKLGLYHHPETEESQLIGLYVSAVAMVGAAWQQLCMKPTIPRLGSETSV